MTTHHVSTLAVPSNGAPVSGYQFRSIPSPATAPTRSLMRADGAVVIPAAVASEVLRALVRDLDAQVRANGGHPSPTVRRILFALHDAAQQAEADRPDPTFDSVTAPFDSSATGSEPTGGATVSVAEAAEVMGCSPRHVRGLIRSGRLPATRIGARTWAVDRAALDEFRHGRGATAA